MLPYAQPVTDTSSRTRPRGATAPVRPRGATRTTRPNAPPRTPTAWMRSMCSPRSRRITSTTSGTTPTMSAVRPLGEDHATVADTQQQRSDEQGAHRLLPWDPQRARSLADGQDEAHQDGADG